MTSSHLSFADHRGANRTSPDTTVFLAFHVFDTTSPAPFATPPPQIMGLCMQISAVFALDFGV